jgi:hypothetical protein
MLQNLPSSEIPRFMNRPDFENNGFAMFAYLLARLQPGTAVHLLQDIIAVCNLKHQLGKM